MITLDGIQVFLFIYPFMLRSSKEFVAMIMQIIKFRSSLSLDEVQKIAQERREEFLSVPGLVQKYYFKSEEPGR